jgi:hypothetical protein
LTRLKKPENPLPAERVMAYLSHYFSEKARPGRLTALVNKLKLAKVKSLKLAT